MTGVAETEAAGGKPARAPRLSPFQRIVLALVLGIATGVFVGEYAALVGAQLHD